ncbi:hypothetical protein E2320_011819 [Naja naja]|nr:hypothetical protein E2320_011819 [Naja naja]
MASLSSARLLVSPVDNANIVTMGNSADNLSEKPPCLLLLQAWVLPAVRCGVDVLQEVPTGGQLQHQEEKSEHEAGAGKGPRPQMPQRDLPNQVPVDSGQPISGTDELRMNLGRRPASRARGMDPPAEAFGWEPLQKSSSSSAARNDRKQFQVADGPFRDICPSDLV